MDEINDNSPVFRWEARGDWSGLKGSQYHLLYAVHLMVVKLRTVVFYAGNDLLSFPPVEPEQELGACMPSAARDDWIQFKNVGDQATWTLNKILTDDTLVLTFVLNVLYSQRRHRSWSATLATAAPLRSEQLRDFIRNSDRSLESAADSA